MNMLTWKTHQEWKRFSRKKNCPVIGMKLGLCCPPLSLSPHTSLFIIALLSRIYSMLHVSCAPPHSSLWEVYYYCPNFTDKEVHVQGHTAGGDGAGIWTWAVWLYSMFSVAQCYISPEEIFLLESKRNFSVASQMLQGGVERVCIRCPLQNFVTSSFLTSFSE